MSPQVRNLLKGYLDLSGGQQDEFDRAVADYAFEMRKAHVLPEKDTPRRVAVARKGFRNLHDLW
jgi:hypothetical protein